MQRDSRDLGGRQRRENVIAAGVDRRKNSRWCLAHGLLSTMPSQSQTKELRPEFRAMIRPICLERPLSHLQREWHMSLFRKRNLRWKRTVATAIVAVVVSTPLIAEEAVDLTVVHRIRQEALQNSKVM